MTPCNPTRKEEARVVLDNWTNHRGNVVIRSMVKLLTRDQLKELLGASFSRKVNEMLKIATDPESSPDCCMCLAIEIAGDDFERVERGLLLPGTLLLTGPKALDRSKVLFDEWKVKT